MVVFTGVMPRGLATLIRCVETGKIYKSLHEVAIDTCYSDTRTRNLIKEEKPINGLHFEVIGNKPSRGFTKKVMNITTGRLYDSLTQAAKETGVSISSISQCINGKFARAGGYEWRFA